MRFKMNIHANVTIKNERLILQEVMPYWKNYAIDKWIIYDDNSDDGSVEFIKKELDTKAIILNDSLKYFNETHNRSRMLEYSRNAGADVSICIDADELLSANFASNLREILLEHTDCKMDCFWYNVVGDINKTRNDPCYIDNYKSFIAPLQYTDQFKCNMLMHTPRTPNISLPSKRLKNIGFIHLQAINKRFYALKQLWYKHFEYHVYNYPIDYINSRYDPVVNNLDFCEVDTPKEIYEGIQVNGDLYNEIEKQKGYKDFVKQNYIKELVTFGEEYL